MTKFSRLNRLEEKRAYRRFILNLLGIGAVILLVLFLGVPALIKFSTLLTTLKGSDTPETKSTLAPFPPHLEIPFTATNSATINVSGYGPAGTTLQIFLNNQTFKTITLPGDGRFIIYDLNLKDGENKVTATVKNSSGLTSSPSETLLVAYKKSGPKLIVDSPNDGDKISGDKNVTEVKGKVEDNTVSVTINNRWVMINDDGSFSYTINLSNGDNQIKIIATDIANNQTTVERKVNYSP